MAYKPLIILEKQKGTTGEIAAVTRRLSTPTIIQPEYQFDVSDMLGIFIPEVSLNDNYFFWNNHYLQTLGYLRELKDVSIISPFQDQVIQYQLDSSLWKNKDPLDIMEISADASLIHLGYGLYWRGNYLDVSIKANIDNASLGNDFYWENGYLEVSTNVGVQGIQGIQGRQGIQGVQGTSGIQGAQGIQGRQGIQGIMSPYLANMRYYWEASTSAPPTDMSMRYNHSSPHVTTHIYMDLQGYGGVDYSSLFETISANDRLNFCSYYNQYYNHIFKVTSKTINYGVGYVDITVTWIGGLDSGFLTGTESVIGNHFTGGSGTQGIQGIQGRQGIQGIGSQGTQGAQGAQGTKGLINDASFGPDFVWVGGLLDVSTSNVTTLSSLTDVSIVNIADSQLIIYETDVSYWKNINTIDISEYSIEASTLFYTKTQIDASFALKSSFTGTFLSDGSMVTVSSGIIMSVI